MAARSGGWRPDAGARLASTVEATLFEPLGREREAELEAAVARFGEFLELDAEPVIELV